MALKIAALRRAGHVDVCRPRPRSSARHMSSGAWVWLRSRIRSCF
jgi:hypothetical protein